MLYEAEVPGIPTTLVLSNKTGGKDADQLMGKVSCCLFLGPTKSEIVYGTSDGRLGQVEIGRLAHQA